MFVFLFQREYLSCLYIVEKMNCLLQDASCQRCAINAFSEDSENPPICLSLHFMRPFMFLKNSWPPYEFSSDLVYLAQHSRFSEAPVLLI